MSNLKPTPPTWLFTEIEASRADAAAGRLVSADEAMALIFNAIEELEAEETVWRKSPPA
jgi:predicted transcriptional regulator